MMTERQIERMLSKLVRLEATLSDKLFQKVDTVQMQWFHTRERLHQVPALSVFSSYKENAPWGGKGAYCWFRGSYTPPAELAGTALYLYPKITGYEAMLWVDGIPHGIYAAKFVEGSHGNHYCDALTMQADPAKALDIALEYYAGDYCIGCMPLIIEENRDFQYHTGDVDVCVKDAFYNDFYFDLKTVNQLTTALDAHSFRRAELLNLLQQVHDAVYYSPEDVPEEDFRAALLRVHPLLKEALSHKNSRSAPFAGLIGHSHMDTAWLWTIDETVKKCARTYSNQISLMEQYPEYKFVQSSACHSEMIRQHYPQLFKQIQAQVAAGRYEPNGGVWVECDCNIVSGESLARQFLWGQRYTREHFGYTSDAFWLPDTFGYSAAIPQIMLGSGIQYFLTTKIDWNDTNHFPYNTFWWKGIDGSSVLTHFNKTHIWPTPENLMEYVVTGKNTGNTVLERSVSNKRLLSFGFGDGGGGPQFEMLEMARRIPDVEGLPKSGYVTVSEFMQQVEADLVNPSTFRGELYLELHRGTLTNQHQIKRNNRLAEIALHNLEYFTVRNALQKQEKPSCEAINPLMNTLLMNQFHDILPGTCIPEAHAQSKQETGALIADARAMAQALLETADADVITLSNTVSFSREDVLYLDLPAGKKLAGNYRQQRIGSLENGSRIAVSGISLGGYASSAFPLVSGDAAETSSPFVYDGETLETPFASVRFDATGFMDSFKDKTAGNRELRGQGYALGTLLLAEDVPSAWDNWDIDADLFTKFAPVTDLLSRELVANGCVELRIRSKYKLTEKSTVTQDMVFYADSPLVRFETQMDWHDNHRFLKTAFDTSIHSTAAKHEIQFGYVERPTTRNDAVEKAKFEVCCHKYTDLSETRYGVAIFNDSKYGITAEDSKLRLSLHKGGNRPDYTGDHGRHFCSYGFLPHKGGFSASAVVKPAYLFNYHPVVSGGNAEMNALLSLNADNIIAETVKPCEDAANAFILRLYECEGAFGDAILTVPGAHALTPTNLLEEDCGETVAADSLSLTFRPFEIKTVRVSCGKE